MSTAHSKGEMPTTRHLMHVRLSRWMPKTKLWRQESLVTFGNGWISSISGHFPPFTSMIETRTGMATDGDAHQRQEHLGPTHYTGPCYEVLTAKLLLFDRPNNSIRLILVRHTPENKSTHWNQCELDFESYILLPSHLKDIWHCKGNCGHLWLKTSRNYASPKLGSWS